MIDMNFHVNGKVVEYALVLANGKRLPIDSKWPSPDLLDRLNDELQEPGLSDVSAQPARVGVAPTADRDRPRSGDPAPAAQARARAPAASRCVVLAVGAAGGPGQLSERRRPSRRRGPS